MKFLALAALVAVASGAACTDAEVAEDPPKCTVTTAAVEADADADPPVEAAEESIDCVLVSDADPERDADDEDEEEEASSALFAGVASAAVAATMMF